MSFTLYDFIETNPATAGSPDTINLWVTQSISNNITSSLIIGLTVPINSTLNGNLETELAEATEVVLQLPTSSLGSGSLYQNSLIETRKKLNGYYYIKLESNLIIPSGSLQFGISSNLFDVGFVPNNPKKFKFQEYDISSFNVNFVRRSTKHLKVAREISSPGLGPYKGFTVPGNYETLLNSFQDNIGNLIPDRLYSDIQESNYSLSSWKDIRYGGISLTNLNVLGNEPALYFQAVDAALFPSSSTNRTIRNLVTSSLIDIPQEPAYFAVLGSVTSSLTFVEPSGSESGSFVTSSKGYSSNYFFSDGTAADLQYTFINEPFNFEKYNIFFYKEIENNENIFIKLTNSKILDKNTSTIYKTNNIGKVIEIVN